jgi:hypothetical protein
MSSLLGFRVPSLPSGPDKSLPRRSVSCYAKPGRFSTAAVEDKV